MKRIAWLLMLVSTMGWAQGACHRDVVQGGGIGISGAAVRVCPEGDTASPCTSAGVSLYSNSTLTTPISNPVTTDANGNYGYCVTKGTYNEQISGATIVGINNNPITLLGDITKSANTWTAAQIGQFIDKGAQVFNVKSYGCIGNGIADDTTCVQAALADAQALTAPGTVFFPPGNYRKAGNSATTSSFDLTAHFVHVTGEGATITYADASCTSPQVFNIKGAQSVRIDGLHFVGNNCANVSAIRLTQAGGINPIFARIEYNRFEGFGNISLSGVKQTQAQLWNGTNYIVPDGSVMSGATISVEADALGLKIYNNGIAGLGNLISFSAPADTALIAENVIGSDGYYPNGPCRPLYVVGGLDSGSVTMKFEHNNLTCNGFEAVKLNSAAEWILADNEYESTQPMVACTAGNTTVCNTHNTQYDIESTARVKLLGNFGNAHGYEDSIYYIASGIAESIFIGNDGTSTGTGTAAWLIAHPGQIQHLFDNGNGNYNLYDNNNDGSGAGSTYKNDYVGIRSSKSQVGAASSVFGCGDGTTLKYFVFCIPEVSATVGGDSKGIEVVDSSDHGYVFGVGWDPAKFFNITAFHSGVGGVPMKFGTNSGAVIAGDSTHENTLNDGIGNIDAHQGYKVNGVALASTNLSDSASLVRTIASGTSTFTTTAVGAGACQTTVTTAATNALTSDVIAWDYASGPLTAATDGMLIVQKYATANNVNFQRCNPTAGSITPTALVINWKVIR